MTRKMYLDIANPEFARDTVWLSDRHVGREYLDVHGGGGSNFLMAYGDKNIATIVSTFMLNRGFWGLSNFFGSEARDSLAEKLFRLTGYTQSFFVNSGSEANEAAVKLALKRCYQQTGKCGVILYNEGSYFGQSLASSSMGGGHYNFYLPTADIFVPVPTNNVDAFLMVLERQTAPVAAFCYEWYPSRSLEIWDSQAILAIMEICKRQGILTITDEVKSGLGRTESVLAADKYLSRADIVTISKAMSGAMPIGAVLFSSELLEFCDSKWYTTTYGGNPIICKISEYLLDSLETAVVDNFRTMKQVDRYVLDGLSRACSTSVIQPLGRWWNLLQPKSFELTQNCREEGLLVYNRSDDYISLLPSIHFKADDFDEMLDKLERAYGKTYGG